jgi:hypothetical protein
MYLAHPLGGRKLGHDPAALSPALLADELSTFEGLAKFSITPVRN